MMRRITKNFSLLLLYAGCALWLMGASFKGDDLFPYKDIGDGRKAVEVALTLVDGVTTDAEGNIYLCS